MRIVGLPEQHYHGNGYNTTVSHKAQNPLTANDYIAMATVVISSHKAQNSLTAHDHIAMATVITQTSINFIT
jgi:hypothetical protein